ncbi:hypothetical protein DL93DRAFT_2076539 [Clavulina sp. PMI_390]|nr:hypothetical protein DL93DRAFT_2076539 [Clavulina sp. PMI_390]
MASNAFSTSGKILVVPIVSTANLPQLAVDILISSLGLERVAILSEQAQYLIPVAGMLDNNAPGITTPLELFSKPSGFAEYALVQQRSPVMQACKLEFIQSFVKYATEGGFSSILFLTGLDLSNRPDSHMITPAYFLPTSSSTPVPPLTEKLSSMIPPFMPPGSPHPFSSSPSSEPFKLPSSGLTVPLLREMSGNASAPASATILQYVLEGDNREDAVMMATIVARAIGITEEFAWKEPSSWRQGLFGAPHDQTLFG